MVPRVETATHGVKTPTLGSQSQRHPGRISSRPRVRNPSIHIQLQQPEDENDSHPSRYRHTRCGNLKLSTLSSRITHSYSISCRFNMEQLQNSLHMASEIEFASSKCKLGSRSSRMVFVEPAAPGDDWGQKAFHTSITPTYRGRNR